MLLGLKARVEDMKRVWMVGPSGEWLFFLRRGRQGTSLAFLSPREQALFGDPSLICCSRIESDRRKSSFATLVFGAAPMPTHVRNFFTTMLSVLPANPLPRSGEGN